MCQHRYCLTVLYMELILLTENRGSNISVLAVPKHEMGANVDTYRFALFFDVTLVHDRSNSLVGIRYACICQTRYMSMHMPFVNISDRT